MEAEKISVSSYTLLQSISRSNTTKKWIFLGPLDILEDTSFKFRIVNQNYLRTKISLNLSISESGGTLLRGSKAGVSLKLFTGVN